MSWEVQHHTLLDGWTNTWSYASDSGELVPETFPTAEAAQAALDEYFSDLEEDVAAGNLAPHDPAQFRIQFVPNTQPQT
ncbi:MAG: hypothetical protein ABI579_05285 [Candidatus Sumerlaeota bacterium]